jgi:hypothetical protein
VAIAARRPRLRRISSHLSGRHSVGRLISATALLAQTDRSAPLATRFKLTNMPVAELKARLSRQRGSRLQVGKKAQVAPLYTGDLLFKKGPASILNIVIRRC